MDIEKLRFPIGKYAPGEIKFDEIETWVENIAYLTLTTVRCIKRC